MTRLLPFKGIEPPPSDPIEDAIFAANSPEEVRSALGGKKKRGSFSTVMLLELGDYEGHPFRGNQYTGGYGGMFEDFPKDSKEVDEWLKNNPAAVEYRDSVYDWSNTGNTTMQRQLARGDLHTPEAKRFAEFLDHAPTVDHTIFRGASARADLPVGFKFSIPPSSFTDSYQTAITYAFHDGIPKPAVIVQEPNGRGLPIGPLSQYPEESETIAGGTYEVVKTETDTFNMYGKEVTFPKITVRQVSSFTAAAKPKHWWLADSYTDEELEMAGTFAEERNVRVRQEFGDIPGHVFHGNQYTGGIGGDAYDLKPINEWAKENGLVRVPERDSGISTIAWFKNEKTGEVWIAKRGQPGEATQELIASRILEATTGAVYSPVTTATVIDDNQQPWTVQQDIQSLPGVEETLRYSKDLHDWSDDETADLTRLSMFDYLIQNNDGHLGNLLSVRYDDGHQRLAIIDNSLTAMASPSPEFLGRAAYMSSPFSERGNLAQNTNTPGVRQLYDDTVDQFEVGVASLSNPEWRAQFKDSPDDQRYIDKTITAMTGRIEQLRIHREDNLKWLGATT